MGILPEFRATGAGNVDVEGLGKLAFDVIPTTGSTKIEFGTKELFRRELSICPSALGFLAAWEA